MSTETIREIPRRQVVLYKGDCLRYLNISIRQLLRQHGPLEEGASIDWILCYARPPKVERPTSQQIREYKIDLEQRIISDLYNKGIKVI